MARDVEGIKSRYYISGYANRLAQLFSSKHPRLRNALLAACTVNLAQQLCGSKLDIIETMWKLADI